MKGSQAIIRSFEEEGVEVVFGYPGGYIMSVYEALRESKVKHVLVRQEQAAVHSASGYARIAGKVGVAIATSGPGATNLLTGIATAYMDSIPLVIITGQVRTELIGRDVFQEVDIKNASESFTKHNYLVKEANAIPRILQEAFYIARSGRPGPVLIDIPADIQEQEIEYNRPKAPELRGYKPTTKANDNQIRRAVDCILKSKRPLLFAGGGILLADATAELTHFAEKARIPVVHTLMGRGVIPDASPYSVGMVGTHGYKHANNALRKADLIIFLGARVADRAAGGIDRIPDEAKIIHIDVDPAEIGKNLGTNVPLVGDAKQILEAMIKAVTPLETDAWISEIAEWKGEKAHSSHPDYQRKDGAIDPKKAVALLSSTLGPDAIMAVDVGQNQFWSIRQFEILGKRRILASGGFGTMGYSLPAAVGASFAAERGAEVVAIVGDGGFQMCMQELGTLIAQNLNIIMIIFNNSRLGMVRELQTRVYGQNFGVELEGNPDFVVLASAYGIAGERVTEEKSLPGAFQRARESKGSYLIECLVDPMESTL